MRPTTSTPPSPVTAAGSSENDGEGGRVLVRGKEARFREEKRQGRGKTEEATTVQPALAAAAVDRPERERKRR